MTPYEIATLVLQSLIALGAFATLAVYYFQLRVMGRQLVAMQESSRAQSALTLVELLQSSEVRAARHVVRDRLSKLSTADWNEEDRRCAALVCANYDVVAALLKANLAPPELIVGNWATSINHCHAVLAPFIKGLRERSGDHRYWSNFDWLQQQAALTNKESLGFVAGHVGEGAGEDAGLAGEGGAGGGGGGRAA
jgi:hypothetical protein